MVPDPGRKPPSPRRGTAVVRADGVVTTPRATLAGDPAHPPAATPSPAAPSPTVHVHIDRVSVTRAPSPAARPSAPAPARPLVDHAAYLARRRERG